ncbi:MAG TPA: hypothetical protein VKR06_02040 [Ktedonosporobacter sp.]|nr:hypothetical protein [Ktedonosporobacter sp.]
MHQPDDINVVIRHHDKEWPKLPDTLLREMEEHMFDPLLKEMEEEKEQTPGHLNMIGWALCQKFQFSKDPRDIKRAIEVIEEAVRISEPSSKEWQQCIHNLGTAFMEYYEHSPKLEYLNQAINLFGQLTEHRAADPQEDEPAHLFNLCSCLIMRFSRKKKMDDLDRAIRLGQEIIEQTTHEAPHRSTHLQNHATALLMRYTITDKAADQQAALQAMVLLVSEMPDDAPERLDWIDKITTLLRKYRDTSSFTLMIEVGQQLVTYTPSDADYLPMLLNIVGTGYMGRFARTDDENDLAEAVRYHEQAFSRCSPNSPYQLHCSLNLGFVLKMRYEETHQLDDLDRAIVLLEKVMAQAPHDYHAIPMCHGQLANALGQRFERTENLADLERANKLRAEM